MVWTIEYIQQAQDDLDGLDSSVRKEVLKAIKKVAQNPLSKSEGSYGKPLGNKSNTYLAGYQKIKLSKSGVRVVYRVIREKETMRVIVIAVRADSEVYKIAQHRIK